MARPSRTRSIVSCTLVLGLACGVARAAPMFTNPLTITNAFLPFTPGGVKVFRGRKDREASVIVDLYTGTTRGFALDGTVVPTRVLQETEFADGQLAEISRNYFAQADDGTIYYFGEVVDSYSDGMITDHEGSWLVGGPTDPSDPPETAAASAPTVFMVPSPQVGDTFKPEDLLPVVDETDTVKKVGVAVHTPAAKFANAIQVQETTQLGDPPETKWYAPGVGVIKGRTKGEAFVLVASTLLGTP
jgi:hypothetical protein